MCWIVLVLSTTKFKCFNTTFNDRNIEKLKKEVKGVKEGDVSQFFIKLEESIDEFSKKESFKFMLRVGRKKYITYLETKINYYNRMKEKIESRSNWVVNFSVWLWSKKLKLIIIPS